MRGSERSAEARTILAMDRSARLMERAGAEIIISYHAPDVVGWIS